MAKLGNMLFSRTSNQFRECKRLAGNPGQSLSAKLEDQSGDNPYKPQATPFGAGELHRRALCAGAYVDRAEHEY